MEATTKRPSKPWDFMAQKMVKSPNGITFFSVNPIVLGLLGGSNEVWNSAHGDINITNPKVRGPVNLGSYNFGP